jgi:hypothetical protein
VLLCSAVFFAPFAAFLCELGGYRLWDWTSRKTFDRKERKENPVKFAKETAQTTGHGKYLALI